MEAGYTTPKLQLGTCSMLIHRYGQFSDVGLTDCDRIAETAKHLLSDSSKGG